MWLYNGVNVGSKSKLINTSFKDVNIEGDTIEDGAGVTAKFAANAVESSEISDGTVTADDLASTLDVSSKTVTLKNTSVTAAQLSNTLDLSSKTLTFADGLISFDREYNNIALLGFKMAVTESLTVFNLLDGIVDEFHDESGTDEGEGSTDTYCATNDYYINSTQPSGTSYVRSAGFSMTAITEPDTSTAGNNPASHPSQGASGEYTVPSGLTCVQGFVWGSGGGAAGGGGGFTSGTIAVTGGQTFEILAGEGGNNPPGTGIAHGGFYNGGSNPNHPGQSHGGGGGGGGLSGIFTGGVGFPGVTAPQAFLVAGSGGGGGHGTGGAGGGTTGCRGNETTETTSRTGGEGGGGSQTAGGQGGTGSGTSGGLFQGGSPSKNDTNVGAGGAGYYGGGGGGHEPGCGGGRAGGGGSSFYGHPQITQGATEEGASGEGGGTASPIYVASTNEGGSGGYGTGEDGYVFITKNLPATATATTIVSNAFAAGSVPTTTRMVIFEENVDTPTLNTDVIASVSRNGGSNFTNVTLADSGYVTGSSGQRILTGQASIGGQPSGQSMRWKIALANNQVKIHGVSLSWA